jgi:hypothetical protein
LTASIAAAAIAGSGQTLAVQNVVGTAANVAGIQYVGEGGGSGYPRIDF